MRNNIVRKALFSAAVLAITPLAALSLSAAVPTAEDCINYAADVSARLAVGGVFIPEEKGATPELTADNPVIPAVISLDDSMMISGGALEVPSAENEEPENADESGAEPYPESLESRDGTIEALKYELYSGESYITLNAGGQVRNITSVSNDKLIAESTLPPDFTVTKSAGPQILIMHTHETESYEPYTRDFYDSSFNSRTTDDNMNMAAVGDAICAELEKAGIGVIHDVTKHDYPFYNGSYDRSRETVGEYLGKYPSISVVLDIHRDAIEREDGTRIAPTTQINGKNAAQVMIICGCDDGTMEMPDYMKNFRFACGLQQRLESDFPTLTRPVLFDYRNYNQDMTTGSLLIEVGSNSNSIDEAVYTGTLIGKSLVNMFLGE